MKIKHSFRDITLEGDHAIRYMVGCYITADGLVEQLQERLEQQEMVLKAIIEVMMETQQERIAQKLGFEVVR